MTAAPTIDVFISHTTADNDFVDRLTQDLKVHGLRTWYDKQDLRIGQSIVGEINTAIADARYLLVVLSVASLASRWVREELNAALMRQIACDGVFLIPARMEDCPLPPLLSHRRCADFFKSYDGALNEVVATILADEDVRIRLGKARLYPPAREDGVGVAHVFVRSERFDRCIKIPCDLGMSIGDFVSSAVKMLELPWGHYDDSLGMKWSYSYGLLVDGAKRSFGKTLEEVGVENGSVVSISIGARYEDVFAKRLQELKESVFLASAEALSNLHRLEQQVASRERTSRKNLRRSANSAFRSLGEPSDPPTPSRAS